MLTVDNTRDADFDLNVNSGMPILWLSPAIIRFLKRGKRGRKSSTSTPQPHTACSILHSLVMSMWRSRWSKQEQLSYLITLDHWGPTTIPFFHCFTYTRPFSSPFSNFLLLLTSLYYSSFLLFPTHNHNQSHNTDGFNSIFNYSFPVNR